MRLPDLPDARLAFEEHVRLGRATGHIWALLAGLTSLARVVQAQGQLPQARERLTRAGAHEALLQDYVKFARAKGLSNRRVIGVHVLRNILIPIVTVIGLEFGSVIAFAIVTESVFAWPGMGKLLIDSIGVLDRPVIVAYLLVIVTFFIVINLLVDILGRKGYRVLTANSGREALEILGEVEAGIPIMRLLGERPLPLVTKAGGFGSPAAISEALTKVKQYV